MKKPLVLAAVLGGLIALAAADPVELDSKTFALSAIDVVPTQEEINTALTGSGAGSQAAAALLEGLASGSAASGSDADIGVRLRAINALPEYYAPNGGSNDPVHVTLAQVITDNQGALSGPDLVVLRAAIESLGALRWPNDYGILTTLLNHSSRDIRAASARALGVLCNTAAVSALRVRYQNESTDEVKLAISETLRILSQTCPP